MTLFCFSPGCRIPRQHHPGCDGKTGKGEECRGCLPAHAEIGQLCERCLAAQRSVLAEIAELYPRLTDVLIPRTGGMLPRVSGTPEPSAPLNLDAWDLLTVSRPGNVHDDWHDQYGSLSVAMVLWLWTRDWIEVRAMRETQPNPVVVELVGWLTVRLDWAAQHHPAIDDFIRETRHLRGRLLTVLGEREPKPQHCEGVACRRCDRRQLYRRADGTGDVDCHNIDCRQLYRKDEYDQWVALLHASARRQVVS